MKILKLLIILIVLATLGAGVFLLINKKTKTTEQGKEASQTAQMANPASVYCKENGGTVEIVTSATGGQTGVCIFDDDSSCEEWAYYRKECQKGNGSQSFDVSKEFAEIKAAAEKELKLDLTKMEVKINKTTGKYASGSVSPKEPGIAGGYLYMAKVDEVWKVVADGNGTISCAQLEPYPDFPVDMIPECVDANGNPVTR